jgi:hypothetical protein
MSEGKFTTPTSPLERWDQLTPNEKAWIEMIRVISNGSDPRITPERVRDLRDLLDKGRAARAIRPDAGS